MSTVPRLKKRSDFLRVAAYQRKVVMTTMIVQLAERSEVDKSGQTLPALRIGFTASRKVGNAVKRNLARRRLRAVVQNLCPTFKFYREDLVIIARPATVTAPFTALLRDFHQALTRLEMPPL
jgi:ribonuclease P protein component